MPDLPLTAELEAIFRMVWERDSANTKNKGIVQKDGAATSTAARAAKPPAITADALKLSSSLVEAFVRELVCRARDLAVLEGDASVEPAHLERILPQLLLDF